MDDDDDDDDNDNRVSESNANAFMERNSCVVLLMTDTRNTISANKLAVDLTTSIFEIGNYVRCHQ